MEDIVEAIHSMISDVLELPTDEDTPEKRVAKIFSVMDHVCSFKFYFSMNFQQNNTCLSDSF